MKKTGSYVKTERRKETEKMNKTYKVHPAAKAFPRMPPSEFTELVADIAAHGIRLPILVNEKRDTILDGRNRLMAAHDLNLDDGQVPIEVFRGKDETAEIVSRNIHRRHLTDDQWVSMVAKLRGAQLTKEAEQRKKAGKAVSLVFNSTQGRSWRQVAIGADVGQHKARSALIIAKHAPEELDRVIAGKEKLAEAGKKARAKAGKAKLGKKGRCGSASRPSSFASWNRFRSPNIGRFARSSANFSPSRRSENQPER